MDPIRMKLQNSEPIRLCTECKHATKELECLISVYVVSGEKALCWEARENPALCGLNGSYWETREPIVDIRFCSNCGYEWLGEDRKLCPVCSKPWAGDKVDSVAIEERMVEGKE